MSKEKAATYTPAHSAPIAIPCNGQSANQNTSCLAPCLKVKKKESDIFFVGSPASQERAELMKILYQRTQQEKIQIIPREITNPSLNQFFSSQPQGKDYEVFFNSQNFYYEPSSCEESEGYIGGQNSDFN